MNSVNRFCRKHSNPIAIAVFFYCLVVLTAGLIAGPSVKPAGAAGLKSTCSHTHVAGTYHAWCDVDNPTSFSFVGLFVKQPYRVRWQETCYSKKVNVRTNSGQVVHLDSAAAQSPLRYRLVSKPFTIKVGDYHADYVRLLKAVSCTVDVTFTRVRRAAAHSLSGLLFINGAPHEIIYDSTKAGQ